MMIKDIEFTSVLQFNKLMLNKDVQIKISDYIQDKINIKNVITLLQLAKLFKSAALSKPALYYTESCFKLLFESKNFLELDYSIVAKLLASSELNIDTEIEVSIAADKWLSYNNEERSKFTKDLLLQVRLPLLSDHALKHIIRKLSSFSKNKDCIGILNDFLNNKENVVETHFSLLCTHRYCDQNISNIFICGGVGTNSRKLVRKAKQINNLNHVKNLSKMKRPRRFAKAVCVKRNVFVFGGYDTNDNWITTVAKYSQLDNCWSNVTDIHDDRINYCICSFMDNIYVIGGCNFGSIVEYSLKFDPNCTSENKWKEVFRMNQLRQHAACTVFEGNIVVSGGCADYMRSLNTVESYDVVGNEWSPMADMVNSAYNHGLVVVKNKLFVIGNTTNKCQVFDSTSNLFVALVSKLVVDVHSIKNVIKIGNELFIFSKTSSTSVFCYDFNRNEWSVKPFKATENLADYSIVNVPPF